ncbi:AAA family ATPase [Tsukamurella ocularis]
MTTPTTPAEQLGVTLHQGGVPITAAPTITSAADGTITVTVPSSDPSAVLRHLDTVLAHTGALRVVSTSATADAATITVTAVPHVSEPARVSDTRVATVGGSSTWHGGIGHYSVPGSVAQAEALAAPAESKLGGLVPLAMVVPTRPLPVVTGSPADDAAPYIPFLTRLRDDSVYRSVMKSAGLIETTTAPIPGAGEMEATRASVTAMPTLQAVRISPRGVQLVFAAIPVGISMAQWEKGSAHISAALGVDPAAATVAALPDGRILYTSGDRDPLSAVSLPTAVADTETTADVLHIGVRENGTAALLPLRDTPSILLSGLPGVGKTAAALAIVASLAGTRAVQLLIADGKASGDLDVLGAAAGTYVVGSGVDEREQLADALDEVVTAASLRAKRFRAEHQTANYWDIPASERPPLIVVLVDEVHRYLSGLASSAEGKLAKRIGGLLQDLVTSGRSLGIITILATQRPSAKSIDADLRESISAAIALRQSASTARMSLGDLALLDTDPRLDPSLLPAGVPGRAVASVPRESDSADTSPLSRVQLIHLDDAAITAALPTPSTTTDGKAA